MKETLKAFATMWRADADFYQRGGEPDKAIAYERCAKLLETFCTSLSEHDTAEKMASAVEHTRGRIEAFNDGASVATEQDGEVVVTRVGSTDGPIVAVTLQDSDGRILHTIATFDPATAQQPAAVDGALIGRLEAAWRLLYGEGDEHDVCEVISEAIAALRNEPRS